MKCPICNGKLKISKVKKKIKGSLVNTGSLIQYCEMDGCNYEKILTGTLPTECKSIEGELSMQCCHCGNMFIGDKRDVCCENCQIAREVIDERKKECEHDWEFSQKEAKYFCKKCEIWTKDKKAKSPNAD